MWLHHRRVWPFRTGPRSKIASAKVALWQFAHVKALFGHLFLNILELSRREGASARNLKSRDHDVEIVANQPQSTKVREAEVSEDGGVDLGGESEKGEGRAGLGVWRGHRGCGSRELAGRGGWI